MNADAIMRRLTNVAAVLVCISAQPVEAATITVDQSDPRRSLVSVIGEITQRDGADFESKTRDLIGAIVVFRSPGGSLVSGLQIGETIKQKKFDTVAEDTCASACALAWVAGVHRFIRDGARVGFHAAYRSDTPEPTELGWENAVVGAYLTKLGLPVSAVVFMTKAAPQSMAWLDTSRAEQYGIKFISLAASDPAISAVLKAIEPQYAPRWNEESCSRLERYAGKALGRSRVSALTILRDNCDRKGLSSAVAALEKRYAVAFRPSIFLQRTERYARNTLPIRSEMEKLKTLVDPDRRLSEDERLFAAVGKTYQYYRETGDPERAERVAAHIVWLYWDLSLRWYAVLEAAARNETLPQGRRYGSLPTSVVHVFVEDDGTIWWVDKEALSRAVIAKGRLRSPEEIAGAAISLGADAFKADSASTNGRSFQVSFDSLLCTESGHSPQSCLDTSLDLVKSDKSSSKQ